MTNRQTIDKYMESAVISFGIQVRAMRQERKLSVHSLAELANITSRTLIFIEKGERCPSLYTMASISIALDFYEWEFFSLRQL